MCEHIGQPAIFLNSGKTAIYLALNAYGMKRADEILVPQYLGGWVLNTMNRTAFPTTRETERTKAVFAFHQYGYPQRMDEITSYARDKGWLVIEDCAHSFSSKYHGGNIGTFGDAAIFSFSKNLPTILGGCLVTKDKKVINYTRAYIAEKRGWWRAISSNAWIAAMFMSSGVWTEKVREVFRPSLEMLYSQLVEYPSPNRFVSRLTLRAFKELESSAGHRVKNLEIFKGYFCGKGYHEEIEEGCQVVPLLAPYIDKNRSRMALIVKDLKAMNIETGIQHFDIERNVLQPDYRECVPIPLHQNISEDKMHRICQIIDRRRKE